MATTVDDLESYFIRDDKTAKPKILAALQQQPLRSEASKHIISELYAVYEKSLINASDLDKEIFFVQLLLQMTAELVKHDKPVVFVKRYLKCSIDSAGYDLELCELAREFLVSISASDAKQADFVLSYLLDTYVGNIEIISDEVDKQSHDYEEHRRFVRSNCEKLILRVIGTVGVTKFCEKLDKQIQSSEKRLLAFDLLGSLLLGMKADSVLRLANSSLFNSILRCLYFDESTVLLNSAINCLTFVMPHLVATLSKSLSELFLIYARLVTLTLERDEDMTPMSEKGNPMEFSSWDRLENVENEFETVVLNYFRFLVFLYGLYPVNLTHFLKNPKHYFGTLDQSLVNHVVLHNPRYDFYEVKAISMHHVESFKMHRNFVQFSTPEEELNDTLRWSQIGSPEEVANFCLSFAVESGSSVDIIGDDQDNDLTQLMQTHRELYTTRKSSITSETSGSSKSGTSSDFDKLHIAATGNLEFYKRELLLIRNDLNFAVYLKNLSEKKLESVLEQEKNRSKVYRAMESAQMSLKVASTKNLALNKTLEQLKDEYKKFKNERLKYEELILNRNKALRAVNDENRTQIKGLLLANEELTDDLKELKKILIPKDAEINLLKLNNSSLLDDVQKLQARLESGKKRDTGDIDVIGIDGTAQDELADKLSKIINHA